MVKTFNRNHRVKFGISLLLLILFTGFISCDEISTGDRRLKLEYLYKMKMMLTSMMDYSFRLSTMGRVATYENDISGIRNEVENAVPVENWAGGKEFKERFIKVIELDIQTTDSLSKITGELDLDSNEAIIKIQERQDSLMEILDSLISKVDREENK